jgi:hypothetical protein
MIPAWARALLSSVKNHFKWARITQPVGALAPGSGPATLVMAVGSAFDQELPNAMMTCRMGYCRGFEQLGIPYLIVDIRDLERVLQDLTNPICMLFGGDLHLIGDAVARRLRRHRCIVWVYPWFRDSARFFTSRDLDPAIWTLPQNIIDRILLLEPDFGFTATVPSGLGFFEEWQRRGIPVCSLPLACDYSLYRREAPDYPDFDGIRLAFVGGYWQSKGRQLDRYLQPFADQLIIYGYNRWPYPGYKGLSPAINEPTVSLLKGQINERVFKVLGSFGCALVDAVPAYRELYSEEELLVAEGPEHFRELALALLKDDDLNMRYRTRGHAATLERHTYVHRAQFILEQLSMPAAGAKRHPRPD